MGWPRKNNNRYFDPAWCIGMILEVLWRPVSAAGDQLVQMVCLSAYHWCCEIWISSVPMHSDGTCMFRNQVSIRIFNERKSSHQIASVYEGKYLIFLRYKRLLRSLRSAKSSWVLRPLRMPKQSLYQGHE